MTERKASEAKSRFMLFSAATSPADAKAKSPVYTCETLTVLCVEVLRRTISDEVPAEEEPMAKKNIEIEIRKSDTCGDLLSRKRDR